MEQERHFRCDWCGFEMIQRQCKVICPNCGARWDCSDLTIRLDDAIMPPTARQTRDKPHDL